MEDALNNSLLDSIWSGLGNFLADHTFNVLLIVGLTYAARKFTMLFVRQLVRKSIRADLYVNPQEEKQREDTLIGTVKTVIRVGIWIIAMMLLLSELGIDVAPLIASAGIAGVALGFGAQSLVKDYIAGMFILVENQYRVGDVIELNQTVSGRVEAFSLRQTSLRDLDGMLHHIPNGEITIATNMTMDYANVNLDLGVGYATDIDKLEKIINTIGEELAADPDWKEFVLEAPKFLRLNDFADSAIEVKIIGKTAPMKQWAVTGELRRRLKKAFDKHDIEIPFPQRVMHQYKAKTIKK